MKLGFCGGDLRILEELGFDTKEDRIQISHPGGSLTLKQITC